MNHKAKAVEFADTGYNIQITGRHVQITDSMKDYVVEKISKIERLVNRIVDVIVILDIQKLAHRVEVILKVGNFKINSQASSTDMYVSIDQAVDKLEAQIRRYKSKVQDHHAPGHGELNLAVEVISPLELEEDFDSEELLIERSDIRFRPHRIVKQEMRPLKTLTYAEAIIKMELAPEAETFMIFKNEADQKLRIIYRLKDGNYGVVEPKF